MCDRRRQVRVAGWQIVERGTIFGGTQRTRPFSVSVRWAKYPALRPHPGHRSRENRLEAMDAGVWQPRISSDAMSSALLHQPRGPSARGTRVCVILEDFYVRVSARVDVCPYRG